MIVLGPGITVGPGIRIGDFPVVLTYNYFIEETGTDIYLVTETNANFVEEYPD